MNIQYDPFESFIIGNAISKVHTEINRTFHLLNVIVQ